MDEEEESALNLVETDGMLGQSFGIGLQANIFLTLDDVWDDDSAYMELLAEQVKISYTLIRRFLLMVCAHECFLFSS